MSTTKDNLLQAHQTMSAVLDIKFQNHPEWKAFKAIDKALIDLIEAPRTALNGTTPPRATRITAESSYVDLGVEALNEAGEPVTTDRMIEFIRSHREIPADPDRAKVNISSSFSKADRLVSVAWRGGRAWWHANRPLPKEAAGSVT
jgi:hypothetical protein